MGEKGRLIFTLGIMMEIKNEIEKMNPEQTIKHIRGNADSAFGKIVQEDGVSTNTFNIDLVPMRFRPNVFTTYLKEKKIELYIYPSKYTNKNRVIDCVIRTIRDKISENSELFYKPEVIAQVVEEYNNTPHSAFNNEYSPKEVHMHKKISKNNSFEII
jgi:hypothetical protein